MNCMANLHRASPPGRSATNIIVGKRPLEGAELSATSYAAARLSLRAAVARNLRLGPADRHRAHPRLNRRAYQIDMQQPVVKPGIANLNAFRQHERALELARG